VESTPGYVKLLLPPRQSRGNSFYGLGQVRETRTALSGLFGRFVARAYLTRYHNFSYFEPIRSDTQLLSGWPSFSIRRKQRVVGDLPDWVIASPAGVAIAEAKGSHNASGPWASLEAAKTQVERVEVVSGKTVLRVKCFAVATRWAVHGNAKLSEPWLVVHDPEDGERAPTPEEGPRLARSVALGHFASLAKGFSLPLTATALQEAKTREPGHLRVPQHEILRIETDDGSTDMIGAVAASVGVLPIPRATDVTEFLAAVRVAHGERSLFFGVNVMTLYRVDQGLLGPDEPPSAAMGKDQAVEDLFSSINRTADGAETIPLQRVRVIRLGT
jgi:hypothetical protein